MTDTLSLWKDGPTKTAIMDFVAEVAAEDSQGFVPPADRIATFDNDGTLWLEKPMPIQMQHGLYALGKYAAENPKVRDQQPFKAVVDKDYAWLSKTFADYEKGDPTGLYTLVGAVTQVTAGTTAEAFETAALEFLSQVQDARFKTPLKQLTYKPMVELIKYLQANGFMVYITSGGGRDFMRAISEELYSVPKPNVIGSSVMFEYAEDSDEVSQVMRVKDVEQPIDDGPGKPVHIHRAIGRRPILAAGNSDGDIEMLKYACGHANQPALALLVHHDDAEREYAYDTGSEKALQLSQTKGWTVISMKNDWNTIFGE